MLPDVENLSRQTQVYIFNVGPWQHTQHMGSLGRYIIEACPEGEKYSKPTIIPGIVSELYPESEVSMKRVDSDGFGVALSIVGIGSHMAPTNSLVRYGVAISRHWPPTKQQCKDCKRPPHADPILKHDGSVICAGNTAEYPIQAAWEALKSGELDALIREANAAAATGPQAVEQTIRERHFQAARLLKKSNADCPWLIRSVETAERKECWACGEPMKVGLPRCPNCKEIVDKALYEKLSAGQK
jgi:hypothetical protein